MVNLAKESDSYGEAVRKFRTEMMDMTQEDFAEMMGVSASTVRNWEQGTTAVPKYFMRCMKVMAMDPNAAMGELGTFVSAPPAGGWRHIPERMHPVDAHVRKAAVEWIEKHEMTARVMDLADNMQQFGAHLQNMGPDYRDTKGTDLLLAGNFLLLQDIKSLLEQMVKKEETEE